jgi:polysaccharide export outer membrane protein
MRHFLIATVLLAATSAVATPVQPGEMEAADPQTAMNEYALGPRDVVLITVFGEDSLSGRFVITDDGTLRMPELGTVHVGGLSKDGLAALLEERLRDGYLRRPQITVQVMEHRSQRVDVTGAVKTPGEYYLQGPTSLLQLLSRAGGIESTKSIGEVRVRRTELVVNYTELASSATGDVTLQAGDVILVPEGQQVFVSGEVKQPGALLFAEGLTVTQALTRVGGPSEFARLRGAYILRDGDRIVINLKRILDGRDSTVVMQPGDQLYLRKSVL